MGSGLLYLSIVILWGAVLVPMWLRRLTQDEHGSIDKFNKSMSLLGSVPRRELPTYQSQTPAQIAAVRRKRTVLTLSAVTVLGTAISFVTGIWVFMVIPAVLLFSFFTVAWRAISMQQTELTQTSQRRLNVSREQLAAQAKEWNAAPTVIPNRVLGDKAGGLTAQQMIELAAAQTAKPVVEPTEEVEIAAVIDEPDQKSATG